MQQEVAEEDLENKDEDKLAGEDGKPWVRINSGKKGKGRETNGAGAKEDSIPTSKVYFNTTSDGRCW